MTPIALDDVQRIREQLARAHAIAADRFRGAFAAQADLPPNDRWRAHLEIQAAALLETARDVALPAGLAVRYEIDGRTIVPWVHHGEPLHSFFRIERTPAALLEYWMLTSELLGSTAWHMTRLVATADEYDDALRRMEQPQIVRALVGSFLPSAELSDDGTAALEATVYTRATEERVERRRLILDRQQELHFHSRELIAEGRGGRPAE